MAVLSPLAHKVKNKLIEVVATMAIAVLIITGLVFTVGEAIKNVQFSKNQALATKYAEEGMEKTRAFRDQNTWSNFKTSCPTYNPGAVPVPFTRTINCLDEGDAEKRKITITVSWLDSSGSHQSQLTSFLSNWVTK
ncbi:hypothetical protein M1545_04375 [Patescibacteria group bacterium]|nr:hypothetical protein [Patescibacteria group bacterium]